MGDNGYVSLGMLCSKEVATTIVGAVILAKLSKLAGLWLCSLGHLASSWFE